MIPVDSDIGRSCLIWLPHDGRIEAVFLGASPKDETMLKVYMFYCQQIVYIKPPSMLELGSWIEPPCYSSGKPRKADEDENYSR